MTFGNIARTFCGNLGKPSSNNGLLLLPKVSFLVVYLCFLVNIMSIKKITLLEMFLMNISCKRAFLAVKIHLETSFYELFQFVRMLSSSTEPENSKLRGIIGGLGV